MQTVYIKFVTEADRVRGFYELAKTSGISSFPGKVYQVPMPAMQTLENSHIDFRRATDEEVKDALANVNHVHIFENHPY